LEWFIISRDIFYGGGYMILEGQTRIPSGCALSGIFSRTGRRFGGADIVKSISVMHDRSNGLGGGFAAYGIYPEYKEYYAFHIFFDNEDTRRQCETFLSRHFEITHHSEIPTTRTSGIVSAPLIWRYFALPHTTRLTNSALDEREYVAKCVFKINSEFEGSFVFSSGKNMGVFKGVGFPEDIARFYMLEDYYGYCFTAHGRYPTNTPGWWGGAHPFALLDFSVVHNGEISSYDANRRAIEMYGYKCNLLTDTEVITYIIDYLFRKKGLSMREVAWVIAAPFWQTIESMPELERSVHEYLRTAFSSQLIVGPFSILVGFENGIMALNDRLKLRSMVVGEKDDTVYIASEEAAIRAVAPELDDVYWPMGGEPVIITLNSKGGEK
jgi:glutamate synthase domain-containing protein 1